MISVWFLMCLWFSFSCSHQYYDQTSCSSGQNSPGTRYTCSSSRNTCETFFVYRANSQFPTISRISNLFQTDSDILISINTNVPNSTQALDPGHDVLVPITCSCTDHSFSQANFTYKVTENTTLSEISCGIFEGLVKTITLAEENLLSGNDVLVRAGSVLRVPFKCACPDEDNEVKYLVTYPLIERDNTRKVSEKFNVSVEEIWEFNHLDPTPTVYPSTTILVPLKDKPSINLNIPDSDPPTPMFLPTIPVEKRPEMSEFKKLVIGFCIIVAFLIVCGLNIKALKKFKIEKFNSSTNRISSLNSCSTPRISTNSCLSPDLLVGIKYSLHKYPLEDLKRVTENFNEDAKISDTSYKGLIDNDEVMIKKMGFEETRKVIDVHSRINHVNIVKLNGVCYTEDDFSLSYLVFEFPSNGSLRDCLASSSSALRWYKRTQIAFDIATGLHYLNYSVIPAAYDDNLSISCENVFLTSTWRAKIAFLGSEKVDVFTFGVVLIELISGKEVTDGEILRDTVKFLVGGHEGGCFDKLRKFVDPRLKDDYPIAEALCLVVLACCCVEDDPLHRPSMDDVLKVLARMV